MRGGIIEAQGRQNMTKAEHVIVIVVLLASVIAAPAFHDVMLIQSIMLSICSGLVPYLRPPSPQPRGRTIGHCRHSICSSGGSLLISMVEMPAANTAITRSLSPLWDQERTKGGAPANPGLAAANRLFGLKFAVEPTHALKVGPIKLGALEQGVSKVRVLKVSTTEIGLAEIGVGQIGAE